MSHLDEHVRKQSADSQAAMASYLKEFEWDHVLHGTFRFQCSLDFTFERLQNWSNGLGRVTQRRVEWVACPELTIPGRYHVHALICGTERLNHRMLRERWRRRNGQAEVTVHRSGDGIEEYICKGITEEFSEARFSPGFVGKNKLDLFADVAR